MTNEVTVPCKLGGTERSAMAYHRHPSDPHMGGSEGSEQDGGVCKSLKGETAEHN